MKKLLYICVLIFLTFSCSKSVPTGLIEHTGETFSIAIPSNWVIFPSDSNTVPKPKIGEVALAVSSTEQTSGFSNNLLILRQDLVKETTSERFSSLNHYGVTESYKEYSLKEEKDFTFEDDETTKLFIFSARYNTKTPKLTFLQTARVCDGKNGFFLTIALPSNITDVAKYEEILKTFACK